MKLDCPTKALIPGLRRLWTEAFGDGPEYLDRFFRAGFSPDRCRCAAVDGTVAAALYWFDVTCRGQKMAYIYAVATGKAFRGQGLCRALLADTHALLKRRGYAGALLSPEGEALEAMYEKFGYRRCCGMGEFACCSGPAAVRLERLDPAAYHARRNALLPPGSAELTSTALDFLAELACFYGGEDFVMAAVQEDDSLYALELLGSPESAPGIVQALGCTEGRFRTPGEGKPIAMFLPLNANAVPPAHLGFVFD